MKSVFYPAVLVGLLAVAVAFYGLLAEQLAPLAAGGCVAIVATGVMLLTAAPRGATPPRPYDPRRSMTAIGVGVGLTLAAGLAVFVALPRPHIAPAASAQAHAAPTAAPLGAPAAPIAAAPTRPPISISYVTGDPSATFSAAWLAASPTPEPPPPAPVVQPAPVTVAQPRAAQPAPEAAPADLAPLGGEAGGRPRGEATGSPLARL